MAVKNRYIPDTETTPGVGTSLFRGHENSQFATVSLGEGIYPDGTDKDIFRAYLTLRKRVYVDQTGMLPESVARHDGTEFDEDDDRSAHFAVLGNLGDGSAAVVACMRMIIKSDEKPLPIEDFFPEAFEVPAPTSSFEVSRFISKIGILRHQLGSIAQLFTHVLAYSDSNRLGPAYGVVEEALEKSLSFFGAPPHRITQPKTVPEYNDVNLGVIIDQDAMKQRIGMDALRSTQVDRGSVEYWGDITR